MSSTLWPLLKVSLKQSFDFRSKNKKNISFWAPVILILVLGSAVSAFYSLALAEMARMYDMNYIQILYAMAGFASLLCVTTTITKVKSTLFGGNDYDLLASLPIPKSHIIFVKFISLYLVEFLYSFILTIPPLVVILIYGCNPTCLVDALILLFTIPMIPLFVAGMLGVLIGFIADRFRFGNIINVILYLALLCVIMYMSVMMNNQNATADDMSQFLNIFCWYNPAIMLLNVLPFGLHYLAFVGVNLFSLGLMILIMVFCYDYFHILLTSTKSHRVYVEKDIKSKGQFKALFMMDLKRYFSSKSYLMQTITGGVLTVVMTIVLLVSFLSVDDPEITDILRMCSPYFCLFIIWCIGIAVPSAASINFEGKCFWQVKTLPVSYKKYTYSKILLSELVLAPFVLIASIILVIFAEKNFISIFTILVLPQIYLFGMNFIGFFINSYFYKLNWTNELEAVKNAKGMIIAMLIDFVYSLVIAAALLVFGLSFGFLYGAIASLAVVSIVTIVFVVLVDKTCVNRMMAIEV